MNDGFLNIDKPEGMTSHDVVARVRRLLGVKRAGHAGTLDPDATGVLVVAVGQATRLLPYLPIEPKEYVARIVFGAATDTEDASGSVIAEADARALTFDALQAILPRFVGEIAQIPPMVSALHHEGRRLYELAREGITVERAPRAVVIHSITGADFASGTRAEATLYVRCGGGTYIRTLCADIGVSLGLPAHMKTLRREAVGAFHRADALSLDALAQTRASALVPMERVLDYPSVAITAADSEHIGRGQSIAVQTVLFKQDDRNIPEPSSGTCVALLYQGRLRALAHAEEGTYLPFRVFESVRDAPEAEKDIPECTI